MMENLPGPGKILQYDYRDMDLSKSFEKQKGSIKRMPMLKCVQWNVERGYKIIEIIQILKRHQADIICLQELDIDCERTDNLNVPLLIAQALKMKCIFVTEFVEFKSKLRTARTQVTLRRNILSKAL